MEPIRANQIIDCKQAPRIIETMTYIAQCNQPGELSESGPEKSLDPWLKSTAAGSVIGAHAGAGMALAVSQFLDEPLPQVNKKGLGGFQGAISAASGSVVAQMADTPAQGAVYGGLTGLATGAAQGWLNQGTLSSTLIGSATGLVSGASAGYVSIKVRDAFF